MNLEVTHPLFLFAALCVGTMGYAIQRGATCTVAAVDEVLSRHAGWRLIALVEASVWVAGILLVAQALGALQHAPQGYALTQWTVIGGVLLGLGAFVNGACVFGAVARLGSGQWAYLFTPVGFYLGCLSTEVVFGSPEQPPLNSPSVVLQSSYWGAALFLAFAAWRLVRPMWGRRTRESAGTPQGSSPSTTGLSQHLSDAFAQRIWAPHAATTVIGITFAFMLLSAGVWAYTDVLALLARGMTDDLLLGTLLLATLLLGALLGGFTAGRWSPAAPRVRDVLRCLAGSALMGWGSLLIPGSNDGLILVGMPMLWSYAWVAFGTMCVTIAVAQYTSTALALWLGAPTAQ